MISEDVAKRLHDRATRGEALSKEEQTLLEKWYEFLDNAEHELLQTATDENGLEALQARVDQALSHLTVVTRRIKEIASENETLRREIADLRHQLRS